MDKKAVQIGERQKLKSHQGKKQTIQLLSNKNSQSKEAINAEAIKKKQAHLKKQLAFVSTIDNLIYSIKRKQYSKSLIDKIIQEAFKQQLSTLWQCSYTNKINLVIYMLKSGLQKCKDNNNHINHKNQALPQDQIENLDQENNLLSQDIQNQLSQNKLKVKKNKKIKKIKKHSKEQVQEHPVKSKQSISKQVNQTENINKQTPKSLQNAKISNQQSENKRNQQNKQILQGQLSEVVSGLEQEVKRVQTLYINELTEENIQFLEDAEIQFKESIKHGRSKNKNSNLNSHNEELLHQDIYPFQQSILKPIFNPQIEFSHHLNQVNPSQPVHNPQTIFPLSVIGNSFNHPMGFPYHPHHPMINNPGFYPNPGFNQTQSFFANNMLGNIGNASNMNSINNVNGMNNMSSINNISGINNMSGINSVSGISNMNNLTHIEDMNSMNPINGMNHLGRLVYPNEMRVGNQIMESKIKNEDKHNNNE